MFDINKTESMTSRERANQMADEDEGKGANLKEKSSSEEKTAILKNSRLKHFQNWRYALCLLKPFVNFIV